MKIILLPKHVNRKTATWNLIHDIEILGNNTNYQTIKYKNNLEKLLILIKLRFKYSKIKVILLYPLFFLPTMNIFIKLLHVIPTLIWKDRIDLFVYDLPLEHNKYINWILPTIWKIHF